MICNYTFSPSQFIAKEKLYLYRVLIVILFQATTWAFDWTDSFDKLLTSWHNFTMEKLSQGTSEMEEN